MHLPFLLSCLVPSLPQEAYGESDWRDPGPRGNALLPSSSVLDELGRHSGSPEVPVGWESGRVGGSAFRLTALLQCGAVAVATPVSFTLGCILHCNFVQRTQMANRSHLLICLHSTSFICSVAFNLPTLVVSWHRRLEWKHHHRLVFVNQLTNVM